MTCDGYAETEQPRRSGHASHCAVKRSRRRLRRIFAAPAVVVMLAVAGAGGFAGEETSGLRELASPARLWLEGVECAAREGATSQPRRFLLAACDPYFVDVFEERTQEADVQTSVYQVRVPGFRGTMHVTQPRGGACTIRWRRAQRDEPPAPDGPYDLWKPLVRHFFHPQYNSIAALRECATFQQSTTGTVARYELPSGSREFVFGPDGVLREKRATGRMPDGSHVEGVLRVSDWNGEPFFPRTLVHERREGAGGAAEITRWQITRAKTLARPDELFAALPLGNAAKLVDELSTATVPLSATTSAAVVRARLKLLRRR
jgi:hypothetical protein